jgi:hypothetical protein
LQDLDIQLIDEKNTGTLKDAKLTGFISKLAPQCGRSAAGIN